MVLREQEIVPVGSMALDYHYIVREPWVDARARVTHNSLNSKYTAGRIVNAWTQTPTKWYPLPLAVGALLLVAIQYRKKAKRARQEVELNEDGLEVIRLKGPWHVSCGHAPPGAALTHTIPTRCTLSALSRYGICLVYGVMSIHSSFLFGSDHMVYDFTRIHLGAT